MKPIHIHRLIGSATLALLASPAFAHQGDHAHFALAALLAHVFETDHIVFAAIAALTGIFAFKAGRRAEARAQAAKSNLKQERNHDPR